MDTKNDNLKILTRNLAKGHFTRKSLRMYIKVNSHQNKTGTNLLKTDLQLGSNWLKQFQLNSSIFTNF